jgi:hypothetical protein
LPKTRNRFCERWPRFEHLSASVLWILVLNHSGTMGFVLRAAAGIPTAPHRSRQEPDVVADQRPACHLVTNTG